MGLLLGAATAGLVALIVGVTNYTTNKEVKDIFDRSARDSKSIAVDNMSRFARLLASNTAVTVRPSVQDHNYSYIKTVLGDMTRQDSHLLYIGVFDADGEVVEESGRRGKAGPSALEISEPITSHGKELGHVLLLYSTRGVDLRIRQRQEENQQLRRQSSRNLVIGGGVALGVGLLIAVALAMWMSRPVRRMAQAADKLGEGKFDVRVDVGGPTEIRQLATTFNSMAGELEASISASIAQAALEHEVTLARRLQREMMPPEGRIVIGDLELTSWYSPAGKMGGDWWTVSEPEGDKPVTIMVGDVIGHGLPAALFTAAAKSAYRTAGLLGPDDSPHQILTTLDEALRGFSKTHTMSCVAAHIDLRERRLLLSIGAHPAPLRFRGAGGKITMELLDGDGPLIGDPLPGSGFTTSEHDFQPGDLLVLYTDGLIEATNDQDRMFGLRRLAAEINTHYGDDLDDILVSLKKTFYAYVADREVDDDVTVVLVRYTPA